MSGPTISCATPSWRDGAPYSDHFGDCYYSRDGGLQESRHVFLEHNGLPERWQQRAAKERLFTIAECGFGTGLNFLVTLDAWLKSAPTDARLHFISAEKHPLTCDDLSQSLASWRPLEPGIDHLIDALVDSYPQPLPGYHLHQLLHGRVSLTLMFGDAVQMFSELRGEVDAWYLDGFSPAKNPQMWCAELYEQMARLSHDETTFSTYSVAGHVRKGLDAAGFSVEKRPGFGRKREMLIGRYRGLQTEVVSKQPWYEPGSVAGRSDEQHAVVVGAGIAGVTTAHALARRGWQVTLVEADTQVAQHASGNPAGIVMPKVTLQLNADSDYYLSAFLFAVHYYALLQQRMVELPWHAGGVLQLMDDATLRRYENVPLPTALMQRLNAAHASELGGVELATGALYFPTAGWLAPQRFCTMLLADEVSNIDLICGQPVATIARVAEQWQLLDDDGEQIACAPTLVLCNGAQVNALLERERGQKQECGPHWPLESVRGQLAYLSVNGASRRLRLPLCYDGYIIPAGAAHSHPPQHVVGAGYDRHSSDLALHRQTHDKIIGALHSCLPGVDDDDFVVDEMAGRVAFRATSRDRLPLIGGVPDVEFYRSRYATLHHGRPPGHYPAAVYRPGLYVNAAHASRGLTTAPLAAEIVAAAINGEPMPVPFALSQRLHPARFMIRDLKRGAAPANSPAALRTSTAL